MVWVSCTSSVFSCVILTRVIIQQDTLLSDPNVTFDIMLSARLESGGPKLDLRYELRISIHVYNPFSHPVRLADG